MKRPFPQVVELGFHEGQIGSVNLWDRGNRTAVESLGFAVNGRDLLGFVGAFLLSFGAFLLRRRKEALSLSLCIGAEDHPCANIR